jgi:NAD(P)-dependent dehydrogenase (short-subunit alcohol dehydrogenase family)
VTSRLHQALVRVRTAPRVDVSGQVMIVTGATSGTIGGETARILTAWGATVVTTTRSCAITPLTHPLDLSDPASVEAFVAWYTETHGRLDVLINNAGVHLDLLGSWKEPHRGADGFELHWRINFLGTMHLTERLLPLQPRVVNVVSSLHARGKNTELFADRVPYSSWSAYGTSKLALVHVTKLLPEAYAVHPGEVYTNIATRGLAEHRLLSRVRNALAPIERFITMTPTEGAQTSVFVATQPALTAGGYYARCTLAEENPDAANRQVSRRLWEQTQEWIRSLT